MKRFFAALLALAVLLSAVPVDPIHAHAAETSNTEIAQANGVEEEIPLLTSTDYPTIEVGVATTTSSLGEEKSRYFSFTPEYTDSYTFYSTDGTDPKGYIRYSDMTLVASDDDSGEDYNFTITCVLEANVTYILQAMNYDEDRDSFYVCLQVNHTGEKRL